METTDTSQPIVGLIDLVLVWYGLRFTSFKEGLSSVTRI